MLKKYLLLTLLASLVTLQGAEKRNYIYANNVENAQDIVSKIPSSGLYELEVSGFNEGVEGKQDAAEEKLKILNEAFGKLSTEQAENLRYLSLRGLLLNKLPDISRLKNIEALDLGKNNLQEFPAIDVNQFKFLKNIHLSSNNSLKYKDRPAYAAFITGLNR